MLANLLVIGGPISVGKSTLVNSIDLPKVPELNEDDDIQMILLENTYQKGRVAPEVIEFFFLQSRSKKYIDFSNSLITHVFDRSIFESLWFAKGNMDSKSFNHFKKLWKSQIEKLIKDAGKPKLYILLTMNWKTFKNRLFDRGRKVEVENFKQNKSFFKNHINEYEEHMKDIFKMFDINYKIIPTDEKSPDAILEKVNMYIKEVF